MPTILRWKGYRFFWYHADGSEPPHVHVFKDGRECKIWIASAEVAFNRGMTARQLSMLLAVVRREEQFLLGAWDEQFGQ
ncbi:MAG: DUF4160 domain-containing protein [Anderseniella sp.]|jgi:hypothetical protein|nr:DUF4160 domain-containing protein [Anderseniella sp.]